MEVSLLKEKIVPVLKKSGVRRAALFGSTVKKDKTPNDIDILVELDRRISLLGFINLKRKLEEIL
ncbi:MAG TPA: nucleotidyltransferase domain-containing protein, partial [Candidatus Paceibacterota bacterium]